MLATWAMAVLVPVLAAGEDSTGRAARVVPLKPLNTDTEVVFGDPETPGQPFVMRIREIPGTIIPLHSHPVDEHITVLQGTFFFAVSDTFDLALLKELKTGGYAFAPKGSTMFGASPDGAIVQVHGVGPFHIHWKNGSKSLDDPDAEKVFRFRRKDKVSGSRGAGTIRNGHASGTHIQYEVDLDDGRLVMEMESALELRNAGSRK